MINKWAKECPKVQTLKLLLFPKILDTTKYILMEMSQQYWDDLYQLAEDPNNRPFRPVILMSKKPGEWVRELCLLFIGQAHSDLTKKMTISYFLYRKETNWIIPTRAKVKNRPEGLLDMIFFNKFLKSLLFSIFILDRYLGTYP